VITMSEEETLFDWPELHKPKKKRAQSRREKASGVAQQDILEVFESWVHHCKTNRGPKPALTEDRIVLIGAAIHDYGLSVCLDAVLGCSLSDWHMGQNPQGKKYNDIELILRNSQNIERFATLGGDRRTKGGFLDEE